MSQDPQEPASASSSQAKDKGRQQSASEAGTGSNEASTAAVSQTPAEMREQLEALKRELAGNLQRKQGIDRQLASNESAIYAFETSYLSVDLSSATGSNSASYGNIVKGYEAYLKTGGQNQHTASDKRKGGSSTRGGGANNSGFMTGVMGPGGQLFQPVNDDERIFSKSSKTYLRSLELRDRDAGVVTASDGEGDDDESVATNTTGTATTATTANGQNPAKKIKRK